jgi:DNA-binding PadR family transcriptional regulator
LQGTLDQIAKHIQPTTGDLLQIEQGSLYPALHRLERKGWLAAKWEPAAKDQKGEFKYHRLTPRYGLRMLRKNPVFTSAAVLSLALGIGANTAIFTLIDTVLWKLFPVKDPEGPMFLGTGDRTGASPGSAKRLAR